MLLVELETSEDFMEGGRVLFRLIFCFFVLVLATSPDIFFSQVLELFFRRLGWYSELEKQTE